MIYSVTKMTMLGEELKGVFSSFEEADTFVELNADDNDDEQRYTIRSWVLDCPEIETGTSAVQLYSNDDDADEDGYYYDD